MKRIYRIAFALILAALVSTSVSGAEKPKLILAVVVDQFRYDYLTRFRADYHAGFERLLTQGVVFTDAHHIHVPTVTAIGHSTFLSGATPSVSGIIGNEWYDRGTKQSVTSVSDESTELLGGIKGAIGSSPRRLLVSTIGDELKMAGKGTKVIGVSIKDRSAILPVGHMADAAYWLDSDTNHFVTSTYYMKELPEWVAAINSARPVSKYLGVSWLPVDGKPGDRPFCSMVAGGELPYCGAIEATPFGNELLEDFAERAIQNENLGGHDGTDILALSFSANDYAGHALGPDAPEIRDISIRTDQLLGKLMDFIDARIGSSNCLVVLTADHGVAPVPEVNVARKMPGGRLDAIYYSRLLANALSARFGRGHWFVSDAGGFFYLDYATLARNKADVREVRRFAAETARSLPHIARVFTSDELQIGEGVSDPVGRAVLLGFYQSRWGDLVMLPEPYYIFAATGTTHGLPYGYDTHVPVIFMGSAIRAGVRYDRIAVNDIAPTLAALLEIETPSGSSGKILSGIFK
jgi:predicted AlkP superfamily pyrophosphatase or phosphodiesterase